ncbi:asparaginyl-tRNA synthetase [Lyophyllum atratum]|nr:asparaginyl-tRNA synthetase [Lyophyllum atratum]
MILRRFASSLSANPASFKLPPTIKQLLASPASPDAPAITVSGWIKSIRRQKNVAFAVLTDGSAPQGLQAVFVGGGEGVKALTNGAAVQLTGKLVPSPGAGQDKEFLVNLGKAEDASKGRGANGKVQILGSCDPETYPIQKQALSTEYLRDHSHLRARTDAIAAMIRLRDSLKKNIGTFFDDQGFFYAHTPILTGNDAEGAGEAFRIAELGGKSHPASSPHPSPSPSSSPPSSPPSSPSPSHEEQEFFSRPAHLTVSHQLHLEALSTSLSRVYTLSPCFRAERSLTSRHLAEFWMLEAEWAFGGGGGEGGVRETCDFVEACLRGVVGGLVDGTGTGSGDLDVLWKGGDEAKRRALGEAVAPHTGAWARITYTDAIRALEAEHTRSPFLFTYAPGWGRALQSEHEKWLAEVVCKGPVFITDYPAALKPFYMRRNPTQEEGGRETVACFDLIVPHVGELVGGSVREERVDVLRRQMRAAGLGRNGGRKRGGEGEGEGEEGGEGEMGEYEWYVDLRRYGGAPHMGFGMGFERLVGWVGGIENVREGIPFPRWAGRMLL